MDLQRFLKLIALAAALMVSAGGWLRSQNRSVVPTYLDPNHPVERRVEDLLSRMTLKEKAGQLNLPCVYVGQLGENIPAKMAACKRFAAGTYTDEIGPGCGFFTLANTILHNGPLRQAEYFNELQKIALTQTRLKIPLLEDEEGTHRAMFPGATVFPEGLAVGSTFDMPLVKSISAAEAQEARAVGINLLSTLVMELDRDPRMGRNDEAYTEDPYLYAQIAKNIVQGVQGDNVAAPDRCVAVLTDFPTQSEPVSGLERGAYVDMPGTPLYPFGYGLSYTEFQYSNLRIDPPQIRTGGRAHVSLDIENVGSRSGVATGATLPPRAFCASLDPGEAAAWLPENCTRTR